VTNDVFQTLKKARAGVLALDGIKDSDICGSANLHPRDRVKRFP
jgi:hypothetical protein